MYQMQGPWSTTVGSGTPVEGSNGPMTQQPGYVRREERGETFLCVCCVLRVVWCVCYVCCVLCVVRSSARRAVCCVLAVRRVVCAICMLHHTNTVLLSFFLRYMKGAMGPNGMMGLMQGAAMGGMAAMGF